MAVRVIGCVAVVILAYLWFRRISKQVGSGNINTTEKAAAAEIEACQPSIQTSEDLLAYTKNCLGFPKKSMDCVSQQIQNHEKYAFAIGIKCTPKIPEHVKEILRKIWETVNKKTADVESHCRTNQVPDCDELLDFMRMHDKNKMDSINLVLHLNHMPKEAIEKCHLLANKTGFSRFG